MRGGPTATLACAGLLCCIACVGPLHSRTHPAAHIVRPGETLCAIARRHHVDVADLRVLNPKVQPRQLAVGTRLHLPGRRPLVPPGAVAPPATAALIKRRGAPPQQVPYRLAWPLRGTLTGRFGSRGPRVHDGIDIGAPRGTPVAAAAAGEVMFSSRHGGYGNVVIVRHPEGVITVYAHHDVNLVAVGQKVRRGQRIARVGATGRASGPHLHFEVRRHTQPQDPLRYLQP